MDISTIHLQFLVVNPPEMFSCGCHSFSSHLHHNLCQYEQLGGTHFFLQTLHQFLLVGKWLSETTRGNLWIANKANWMQDNVHTTYASPHVCVCAQTPILARDLMVRCTLKQLRCVCGLSGLGCTSSWSIAGGVIWNITLPCNENEWHMFNNTMDLAKQSTIHKEL